MWCNFARTEVMNIYSELYLLYELLEVCVVYEKNQLDQLKAMYPCQLAVLTSIGF